MGWMREVLETVERIKDIVEGENRAVKALERLNERLEEQNKELFNKLMARDWESWVSQAALEQAGTPDIDYKEISPEYDDNNAGEILEMSDDS